MPGTIRIPAARPDAKLEAATSEPLITDTWPRISASIPNIDITADSVLLRNRAVINTPSLGAGRGGDLMEWSRTLELLDAGGQAFISTSAFGTGDSGKLTMFADSVLAPAGAGGFLSGSPARRPGASR